MLGGPDNLSASIAIYTSKCFVMCFNFCLFPDYDQVVFPSQILISQVFPIIILSHSLLSFVSSLSLSLSVMHSFAVILLPNFLVRLHPMMPTP